MVNIKVFISIALSMFVVLILSPGVEALGCFSCTSVNGNASWCDDPTHRNFSSTFESPCLSRKTGQEGRFPAHQCVTISGTYTETNQSLMIRTCSAADWKFHEKQCQVFKHDDKFVNGCMYACEHDKCNGQITLP